MGYSFFVGDKSVSQLSLFVTGRGLLAEGDVGRLFSLSPRRYPSVRDTGHSLCTRSGVG